MTALATYALTTVEDVKRRAGTSGDATNLDDKIRLLINAASEEIMAEAGREFKPLVTNPATRTFRILGDTVYLSPYDLQPAGAGLAISTVTGAGSTLVSTPLTTDDYLFDYGATVNQFTLLSPPTVPARVSVTGTWGWVAVPAFVTNICTEMVAETVRRDMGLPRNNPEDTGGAPPRMGLFMTSVQRAKLGRLRTPVVA